MLSSYAFNSIRSIPLCESLWRLRQAGVNAASEKCLHKAGQSAPPKSLLAPPDWLLFLSEGTAFPLCQTLQSGAKSLQQVGAFACHPQQQLDGCTCRTTPEVSGRKATPHLLLPCSQSWQSLPLQVQAPNVECVVSELRCSKPSNINALASDCLSGSASAAAIISFSTMVASATLARVASASAMLYLDAHSSTSVIFEQCQSKYSETFCQGHVKSASCLYQPFAS